VSERSFEADQAELEAIVERLERGEVGLEELTTLWERGEALGRRLSAELAETRGRIEELARRFDEEAPDPEG
jgi:exodeoxyribonuclease VII small subunit